MNPGGPSMGPAGQFKPGFPPRGGPMMGPGGPPGQPGGPFGMPPGGGPMGMPPYMQHPHLGHPGPMGHPPPHPAQAAAQAMRKRHGMDNFTAEGVRANKRGKPTSRSIPPSIQQHIPESALYGQLQKDERALDWTLARKRAELTDGMPNRPPRVKRTLRLFLSNTCANQPFQKEEQAAIAAAQQGRDPLSAEGSVAPETKAAGAASSSSNSDADVPSWTLRIEGRLLEPSFRSRASNARAAQQTSDRIGAQKFSNIVKTCIVELQRDPALFPAEQNLVEWHRPNPTPAPPGPPFAEGTEHPLIASSEPGIDGFEIKRKGSEPVKVKIAMYISHTPERFALSPEFGALLDLKEETRQGVVQALWGYIRDKKLLDERDRRRVLCDPPLARLLNTEVVLFQHLPEIVNRFLHPPAPVVIEYWVRTDVDAHRHPCAYDIEIEMEDWSVRARQEKVLSLFDASNDKAREITELDEKISQAVTALSNHASARSFLYSFSQDPAHHIRLFLLSQSRDLDAILGLTSSVPGAGVNASVSFEEMRRAETFKGTWLEEAILGQISLDTVRRKKELEKWERERQREQQQAKDGAAAPGGAGAAAAATGTAPTVTTTTTASGRETRERA